MCWPINTSDRVVNGTLGDPHTLAEINTLISREKARARQQHQPPDLDTIKNLKEKLPKNKDFPRRFTKTVQMMYGSKCIEHNHITNTEHLRTFHGTADPVQLIQDYHKDGSKESRTEVCIQLGKIIRTIQTITRRSRAEQELPERTVQPRHGPC